MKLRSLNVMPRSWRNARTPGRSSNRAAQPHSIEREKSKSHWHGTKLASERIEDQTEAFERGDAHQRRIAFLSENHWSVSDFAKVFKTGVAHFPLNLVAIGEKERLCCMRFDS